MGCNSFWRLWHFYSQPLKICRTHFPWLREKREPNNHYNLICRLNWRPHTSFTFLSLHVNWSTKKNIAKRIFSLPCRDTFWALIHFARVAVFTVTSYQFDWEICIFLSRCQHFLLGYIRKGYEVWFICIKPLPVA